MSDKRLPPELEKKLEEEIAKWPALSELNYSISDDEREISISVKISTPNSENAETSLKTGEKLLNATFKNVTIINDVYTFILEFNQK